VHAAARSLALIAASLAIHACAVDRPEGAYSPQKIIANDASTPKRDAQSDEEIYDDVNQPDDDDEDDDDPTPAPGRDAAQLPAKPDAGKGEAGEPPPPTQQPKSPLVGDYWMRAAVESNTSVTAASLTVETNTKTQIYSLVRVDERDEALTFQDFQCTITFSQTCIRGCTSVSTKLLDPARSGRAFVPPLRALSVDEGGMWSASAVPYALGWRGDFNKTPDAKVPSSASDPLVFDPDQGKFAGLDITVRLKPTIVQEQICEMGVVQKIAVSYAGKLEAGALRDGTMTDVGSTQNVLGKSPGCRDSEPTTEPGAKAPVRLIPAPKAINRAALPWPCPTVSEFESAFR
jgi:hypothetical protein